MSDELYLIDTSIWIEVLRPGRDGSSLTARVDELLAADVVATTSMVRLELLGGCRSREEWSRLERLLLALHPLTVGEQHWEDAARVGFELRRAGTTVPFTDLLIGSVAMMGGAVLVHRDRHFDAIAARQPLRVESFVRI